MDERTGKWPLGGIAEYGKNRVEHNPERTIDNKSADDVIGATPMPDGHHPDVLWKGAQGRQQTSPGRNNEVSANQISATMHSNLKATYRINSRENSRHESQSQVSAPIVRPTKKDKLNQAMHICLQIVVP